MLGRARLPGDPLRQPRRRPLDQGRRARPRRRPRCCSASARGLAYHLDDMADDVDRAARRARDRDRAPGRRLDGRDDRPGRRLPPPRPGALAGDDHDRQRQAGRVAAAAAGAGDAARQAAADAGGSSSSRTLKTFEVIGSPAYPMDDEREAEFRATLELTWDRGHNPAGVARQLHAITSSGDRTASCAASGRRRSSSTATATRSSARRPAGRWRAAIPGAELRLIEGMGHDMPPQLFGGSPTRSPPTPRRESAPARTPGSAGPRRRPAPSGARATRPRG